LWLVLDSGIFSTRPPRGLWVATELVGPLNVQFFPSPPLASDSCPNPFVIEAVDLLEFWLGMRALSMDTLDALDPSGAYRGSFGGHTYFGSFTDEFGGIRVCLQPDAVRPIERAAP
jgi:hypothetical protein